MAHKVLLFLGAGANVGAASVKLFKSRGYRIASVARTIRDEVKQHSDLCLTADFSNPSTIKDVFEKVERELGVPNVVVYNPYSWSMGPDPENPLSASLEAFEKDLAINTTSAIAAAQVTVEGFKKLPSKTKKTFIYTGNNGNTIILPVFLNLGLGKSSAWYLIQTLVATPGFTEKGFRFYYTDERTPEGKAMHHTSGPGHAEFFLQLAEQEGQKEALATFVRGKGYTKFERDQVAVLPVVTTDEVVDHKYGARGTQEASYGQ